VSLDIDKFARRLLGEGSEISGVQFRQPGRARPVKWFVGEQWEILILSRAVGMNGSLVSQKREKDVW